MTKNLLGKTLYLKFPSFNVFGNNGQELNDMDYYNHTVRTYDIPNVSNLTASKSRSGTSPNYTWTITVKWKAPDWGDYGGARVCYKLSTASTWTYAGVGDSQLVFTNTVAGTYDIAVATKDSKGNYETPDDSAQVSITLS